MAYTTIENINHDGKSRLENMPDCSGKTNQVTEKKAEVVFVPFP